MTDPFDLARAQAMIVGYDARWLDAMAGVEVLAVEAEFEAPLVNPDTGRPSVTWTLVGKLDVVIRDAQGRTLVVEHKTASGDVGAGSDYVKRLRLDGQVSVYYAGAAALGHVVDGCLYDVLVKPALRPLKRAVEVKLKKDGTPYANQRLEDETPGQYRERLMAAIADAPSDYYQRAEVVRLEEEMRGAMADVWQTGRTIREMHLAQRAPRNPDACIRYGTTCQFFAACTGEASLDDPSLYRISAGAHEELSTAGGNALSASRLRAFRACPRLHHLSYVQGYRPVRDADALRFGTLVHRALEAWWRAPDRERLTQALAALTHDAPVAIPAAANL